MPKTKGASRLNNNVKLVTANLDVDVPSQTSRHGVNGIQ